MSTPPSLAASASPAAAAQPEPPAPLPSRVHSVDTSERARTRLRAREEEILKAVEQSLDSGRLELPNLPATSAAVMQIVGKSNADVAQIVALISTDPVLSSELLKTANSVLYAGAVPTETLQAAVVRIGMRQLRMLILTVSLRGAVLSDRSLALYAEEVWRQSYTMAWIARAIAKPLGFDPDKAFLMTLVADIGKVPLLAELSREMRRASLRPNDISPALVGGVFHSFHERAGSLLAKAWHMSEEFISVAGCHHAYNRNTQNREAAALVSLAQRIDMTLQDGDEEAPGELVHAPEFEVFSTLVEARRWEVVQMAQKAHAAAGAEVASAAA